MFGISLLLTRGRLEISSLTVSVGCSVNPALLSSSTHCFGVLRSEHVLVTLHLYRGVPAICEIPCLPATLGIHNVSHWQHYGIRPHYSLHLLSCMDFLSPVLGFADIQLGSVQGCNGPSPEHWMFLPTPALFQWHPQVWLCSSVFFIVVVFPDVILPGHHRIQTS